MKKKILTMLFITAFSWFAIASEPSNNSKDIVKVIQIADNCLIDNQIDLEKYKLIKAENLHINNSKYIGPNKWYVVFKLKKLIPKDENGILGAGGEIFVEVNLKDDKAKILGYGE